MPVENFLRFQGKYYDVGTRLKYRHHDEIREGTIYYFDINQIILKTPNGGWVYFSQHFDRLENKVVEIIEPVYYAKPMFKDGNRRVCPSYDAIFNGWVWYIILMIVGLFFKEGLYIWVGASLYFFLWKNGFLNGGK